MVLTLTSFAGTRSPVDLVYNTLSPMLNFFFIK